MTNTARFFGAGRFDPFRNNKNRIGEAGGFQDYLWGFGIRYAMISGEAIARSMIDGRDWNYLWRKEIGGKMKASISNRMWFSWPKGPSYRAIISVLKENDPVEIFGKAYNENRFSRLLYPLAKACFDRRHGSQSL